MSDQLELFPETVPPFVEAADAPEGAPQTAPVPRTPGWVLVGSTSGPRGFHRVQTVGQNGTLLTCCGVVGRRIADDAVTIQPCATCAES